MLQVMEAIYENGVLRPLEPLKGFPEYSKLKITIEAEDTETHPLLQFARILSDEEATELTRIIGTKFEKIDPNGW